MNTEYGQLEKRIVALLADGSATTVRDIQTRLAALGSSYSVQAIYHIFRKLRRQGVVLKFRDRFSLSLSWALDLVDLARQIETKLLQSVPARQVVPAAGERLSWSFANLPALDDFWVQLMLLLLERSPEAHMYNYCPHPWFYFAQQSKMDKFFRVTVRRRSKFHLVIGGRSYLDYEFSRGTDKRLYTCIHASGRSVGGSLHRHIMIIGDYVIKVQLPRTLGDSIDAAFRTIEDKQLSTLLGLQQIINRSTRARLSVSHDARAAAKLRRGFQSIFRHSEPARR